MFALEGIRVLDFGQFLAGPFGAMILADLGAEVIKVEPVRGDGMRMAGKPFLGCQRGKKDIAIDLKRPEGLDIAYKLVERADVVHHNMTKGTAERLKIDYETLKGIKPDLIYCNTWMYGRTARVLRWPRSPGPGRRRAGVRGGSGSRGKPASLVPLRDGRYDERFSVRDRRTHRPLSSPEDRRGTVRLVVSAERRRPLWFRGLRGEERHSTVQGEAEQEPDGHPSPVPPL